MSHGPVSDGSSADLNLTPLLDVVLQLLMFFMINVKFVSEEVTEGVKLPDSTTAQVLDKADRAVLFVNLKPFSVAAFQDRLPADALARAQEKFREGDPCVTVFGKEPMKPIELKFWLKQRYEDERQASGKVDTSIVLRADRNTDYSQVFELLQMCKVTGYKKLKLRALTQGGAR
jgi:biopolymer transport protein ExbD